MKKKYSDKDFFIADDGSHLFEIHSRGDVKFLCLTEEEKKVKKKVKKKKEEPVLLKAVVGYGDNIPLWNKNVTLKWKFNAMFDAYSNSDDVKNYIRGLINSAILSWGTAAPIQFKETSSNTFDFDITMAPDNCTAAGACSLAAAFFPNANQNSVALFPRMFTLNKSKQVDTIIHEMGHIFGLRHYFAQEKEDQWRSEIFGHHNPLTIMNYGDLSTLTAYDKEDLETLYNLVWSGKLKDINGLPVELFNSFTQATR